MNLKFNYAKAPINNFIKSQGNFDGALKCRENIKAEFYFDRDLLQALIYGFDYHLFKIISIEEFRVSILHQRNFEIVRFLSTYVFNWEWDWEDPHEVAVRIASRARNFFVKMLVVDNLISQFELLEQLKAILLTHPNEQHFYLAINFNGQDVDPINSFDIEVWNNNFEYNNC